MALKAILFDLDNTLIDWDSFTIGWHTMEVAHLRNVHTHLANLHPDFASLDQFIEHYTQRLRDAWHNAHNSLHAPHLGQLLVDTAVSLGMPIDKADRDACLEAYAWGAVEQTVLFPEVIDTLTWLQARGLHLGIVTNSSHPAVLRDQELREHGLFDFFPLCRVTAADAGYLKPHPAIFEFALQKLGVTAEETLFVGDNPVADIAGAQGAGMRAVLRQRPDDAPTNNVLIVPDATIVRLDELQPLVEDWAVEWS